MTKEQDRADRQLRRKAGHQQNGLGRHSNETMQVVDSAQCTMRQRPMHCGVVRNIHS